MNKFEGISEYSEENELPYAIIVYKKKKIVHICLYPDRPSENDLISLKEELCTDPDFDGIGNDDSLIYRKAKVNGTDYPNKWPKIDLN